MFFVHILVSVPLARQERVLFTDDLPVKKRHLGRKQRWALPNFEDLGGGGCHDGHGTEGALRLPTTYDNHPNPIPQSLFNHLNIHP